MENLQKILSEIIADFIPDFISIEDISRLSGGSSNESWKITLNTRENKKKIVFRRTPGGNLKDEESNNFVDITDGALFYHADYVTPAWAKTKIKTVEIQDHIFYRWEIK